MVVAVRDRDTELRANAERIRAAGKRANYKPEVDEIIEHLARNKTGRDVALIMSNGGFGAIWERLLARLKQP